MGWQEHRNAPAPGTVLCAADEVPDGGCRELRYGSGDAALCLLLYRRGDEVRGYLNCCPHFSLPLNAQPDQFVLMDGGRIMCAWHCAVFRLDDGHCLQGPALGMGLEAVPVYVDEGNVRLGPAPAGKKA